MCLRVAICSFVILSSATALCGPSSCASAHERKVKKMSKRVNQNHVRTPVRKQPNPAKPDNSEFHSGNPAVDDFVNGKSKSLTGYDAG